MNTPANTPLEQEASSLLADLVKFQMNLGAQLLKLAGGPGIPRDQGCCEIPEPCWMPQSMGEIHSICCQGSTAVVRLVLFNCDRVSRTFTLSAAGIDAGLVSLQPTALSIGPKERRVVLATLKLPVEANPGQLFDVILWVRGCKEHYLRWIAETGASDGKCCHEVEVSDCPDLVHHWYDHFYCARPCLPGQKREHTHG